jgi:hypothetical protein
MKNKFSKKIEHFKELSRKSSGDKDFNKIFDYYNEINKQADSTDISEKIDSYIRNEIPNNYLDVIYLTLLI